MSDPRIEVDATALRQVLVALNGAGHEIRELQVLRGPLWPDNPIDKLTDEFNAWCAAGVKEPPNVQLSGGQRPSA